MVHALQGMGDLKPGDIKGATALVLSIIAPLAPAAQQRRVRTRTGLVNCTLIRMPAIRRRVGDS
jgi:hypothetical protein